MPFLFGQAKKQLSLRPNEHSAQSALRSLFLGDAIQISRKRRTRTHTVSAVAQTPGIAIAIALLDGFAEREATGVALGTGFSFQRLHRSWEKEGRSSERE